MKLSIVIPTYTLTKDLEKIALRAVLSYKKQADEVIISEDGGKFSLQLMKVADIYCYSKHNVGFTKNVNRGWKIASGDFVAIVNSDTYLVEGNLKDLCIKDKVTSPVITNQHIDGLAGPFWVTPKEVAKEKGYLIEAMKTYYSDEEYKRRIANIFQKVPSVKIWHNMAETVTPAGIEGKMDADKKVYETMRADGQFKW